MKNQTPPNCRFKRVYWLYGDALTDAQLATRKAGQQIVPYVCPSCGAYHLTKWINYIKYNRVMDSETVSDHN